MKHIYETKQMETKRKTPEQCSGTPTKFQQSGSDLAPKDNHVWQRSPFFVVSSQSGSDHFRMGKEPFLLLFGFVILCFSNPLADARRSPLQGAVPPNK